MGLVDTKGSHVIVVRDWVDRELGAGTFHRLAREVNAPKAWLAPLLSASWYDVDILMPMMEQLSEKTGLPLVDIATQIATENALRDLRGIYSAFMRILNPVNLLRFTPQLWRNYVNFGDAKAVQNDRGFYIGEGSNFPERYLEWVAGDWLGFIPTGISLAGGHVTKAEITKKTAENGGLVRLEVTYTL